MWSWIARHTQIDEWLERGFEVFSRNPIRWALAWATGSMIVGGSIFSFVEDGVSVPDGIWWAFISAMTVGYGDLAPKTTEVRFLAVFVIVSGLVATWLAAAVLTAKVVTRNIAAHEAASTPELDDDVEACRQQINDALDIILARVNHPEVVETLRKIHAQEGGEK